MLIVAPSAVAPLMDVFREYKPLRNKIALLSVEEALGVIWAYCQYLQIDNFHFPSEIEVASEYLNLDTPQIWIATHADVEPIRMVGSNGLCGRLEHHPRAHPKASKALLGGALTRGRCRNSERELVQYVRCA